MTPPERSAVETLEEIFARETEDPEWEATVRARIASLIEGRLLTDARLGATKCRRSICRIEMTMTSTDAQRALVEQATRHSPFNDNNQAYFRFDAGPGPLTVVYLSRPGHTFPLLN